MTKSLLKILLSILILLLIVPSNAQAHTPGGGGLANGLAHPLLGLDHILAMIAVGIIGLQFGGKAKWLMPAAFISFMLLGGLLALMGINLPFIETGIAVSVLIFGSIITLTKKINAGVAFSLIALFAIFHGHAHASEMPAIVSPALYAGGFILSTTVLHVLGIVIGQLTQKTNLSFQILRISGAAISLSGIYFLLGM